MNYFCKLWIYYLKSRANLESSTVLNNLEINNTKSDLMTREEVSKLLNVSLVTLHNWEKKKVLVSRKVGGRVLYLRDEVYSRLK